MINDVKEVHYDRLYLFCGLQYDYPIKVVNLTRQPKNVVLFNTVYDIEDCLMKSNEQKQTSKYCKKFEIY